jgi:hypothetical protein
VAAEIDRAEKELGPCCSPNLVCGLHEARSARTGSRSTSLLLDGTGRGVWMLGEIAQKQNIGASPNGNDESDTAAGESNVRRERLWKCSVFPAGVLEHAALGEVETTARNGLGICQD